MPQTDRGETAERLLDLAEDRARSGGYDGFSFRDLAADAGIKSASVHYHFPSKADLGAALTARYADRFLATLGDNADLGQPADAMLARLVATFRRTITDDDQMCLGGLFGAGVDRLPLPVAAEVRDFFARLIAWTAPLCARRGAKDPEAAAMALIAALEGGLLVARALGTVRAFDAAATAALGRR